jgi:parvulin-like peptidyl-prolyl isomerase
MCERDGIKASDAEVNSAIAQSKAQFSSQLGKAVSDAEYESLLASQGTSLADLRTYFRKQILLQRWISTAKAAEIKAIPPITSDEILRNYELLKSKLVQPESARIALAYYTFAADTEAERDKGAQTIRSIQDRLAKGESFDSVRLKAVELSYSASRDLLVPKTPEGTQVMAGFGINRDQFDMIFALRDGTNTAPFQTKSGWFIARKFETFPQKQLELSDPIAPGQTVTVQNYIAQGLAQQRQSEFLSKTLQELKATLRSQAEVKIIGKP